MFWKKRYARTDYEKLFRTLEKGIVNDCLKLLFRNDKIEYLSGAHAMLAKYKRPLGYDRKLSLHSAHTNGEFELIVVNVPWKSEEFPFMPLIVQRGTGIIYGIMLPFNEILPEITPRQNRAIGELGALWTKFAIDRQFEI
jgi:hypothetical protein